MVRTRAQISASTVGEPPLKKNFSEFSTVERYFMVFALLILKDVKQVIEKWPFIRNPPSDRTIQKTYKKFLWTGEVSNMVGRGRKRTTKTAQNIGKVLNQATGMVRTSLNNISSSTRIPRTCVQEILHENNLRSFKTKFLKKVITRHRETRIRFCRWFLRWNKKQSRIIWYSDECSFSLIPVSTGNNCRTWSSTNNKVFVEIPNSHLKVKVWAAISTGGGLLWEFQEGTQTAESYKALLKRQLPQMDLQTSFFQQDGSPIHTAFIITKFLQKNYRFRWIGLKSIQKVWPPSSPDLTPCDFYLWSKVKDFVDKKHPENKEELKAAIEQGYETLDPNEISHACKNVTKRCKMCLQEQGGNFEQLL